MSDSGVSAHTVNRVLQAHGVDVYTSSRDDGLTETKMFHNGVILVECFPEIVPRKMLHYLCRRFGLPIHHFYNPDQAPGGTTVH